MEINFKKRHIVLFIAVIFALFLIIPNVQTIQKILRAKEISELNGKYHYGEYVKLDFDNMLYIEYDALNGGPQKRYAVCSTLEGDSYIAKIFHGCFILLFCIIFFYYWGGVKSIVRKDRSEESDVE